MINGENISYSVPGTPLILGKIGSASGISGWVKLFSYTQKPESIFEYNPWFINRFGKWQIIELEDWKTHYHKLIFKIKNIDDRSSISHLTNYEIMVDSDQLLILEEGNYYWKDLIGCKVINLEGYEIGKVVNLIETGSNDVLVVCSNFRNGLTNLIKEILIPFLHKKVIKKINIAARIIKVDWQPDY